MKSLKAAIGIGVRRASQRKQAGVATILVILMVGVGLVAVSVGTLHSMRNTQERQLVAHAQVNAQAGAWAAVEAVRQFLGKLTAEQLAGLQIGNTWNITSVGTDGLTQTTIVRDVAPPSGTEKAYKIKAEIGAVAAAGQSSSTIEVVYEVTPGAAPSNYNINGFLDFYNDLNMSGGIELKNTEDQKAKGLDFNVDGDFIAGGTGVMGDGIRNISVTGNVSVGSDIKAKLLKGRNVSLTGGSMAEKIEAWGIPAGEVGSKGSETSSLGGDTCCGIVRLGSWDSKVMPEVRANGEVYGKGSGAKTIHARKTVDLSSDGAYESVNSLVDIFVKDIKTVPSGKTLDIHAARNVTLSGDKVTSVKAGGDVSCSDKNIEFLITAAGSITNCKLAVGSSAPTPVALPTIPEVSKVELKRPTVDSWKLKDAANYAIELVDGKVQVTVKNINGLDDAVYYIGTYAPEHRREYLCKGVKTTNKTQCDETITAKVSAFPFCTNGDDYNYCFAFDHTAKKMTMRGTTGSYALPPGVIWFNGDLVLETGPYFNTFVATKNITSSGDLVTYALNYAAEYDKKTPPSNAVCKNQYKLPIVSAYQGKYPKNYCAADGTYTPNALGNIALIAGGYDPVDNPDLTKPTKYSGGMINLTAKNEIFGTIVAGDLLKTSGDTTVHGYVSAAGLQLIDSATNIVSAKTTIDLTNLPSTYKPNEIPNMGGGGTGTTAESKVLWTRYL